LFNEDNLKDHWEQQFGKSFALIPEFNPLNDYYSREMNTPLERIFLLTSQTFPREFLLSTKLQSLIWEKNWAIQDKRMVNVDIGFLSLENFILATTKNYSHRVYLGQDIFADLTYHFYQGEFQTLPWTYPDFVDPKKKDFLTWGRAFLLQILNR
jgi:hypothetical protein